jgi:orotate phosphoribosyltransferase
VDHRSRLIEILREKSVKTGTFTLASGKTSDFYVDARQTSLNAEGAWLIGTLVHEMLHPDVIAVGGLTLGADPVACATATVSWSTPRPIHAFLIRKIAKGHGTGQFCEGLANVPKGSKVAILEDTSTTGGSLLTAVERAEAAGLEVVQCITVVDRLDGAGAAVEAAGHKLQSIVTRTDLVG